MLVWTGENELNTIAQSWSVVPCASCVDGKASMDWTYRVFATIYRDSHPFGYYTLGHHPTFFLSFIRSSLYRSLQVPGYLYPGLVIFGDLAYVNNSYMVTPYKNGRAGERDNFNFFQFTTSTSILNVHLANWFISGQSFIALSSANFGVKKQIALVHVLCSLHNFHKEPAIQQQWQHDAMGGCSFSYSWWEQWNDLASTEHNWHTNCIIWCNMARWYPWCKWSFWRHQRRNAYDTHAMKQLCSYSPMWYSDQTQFTMVKTNVVMCTITPTPLNFIMLLLIITKLFSYV